MWIGRPVHPEFNTQFNLETLRQRMQRYQIQGGVVSNFTAKDYDPAWGNYELLKLLAGTGLWAGIVLVPEMFDPQEAGRVYLSDCIMQGARLARVFPRTHNFTLQTWCSGALLRCLDDHRMPIVVWHTEVSWHEIYELCRSYPNLAVIVEGTGQKIIYHSRMYYSLLELCPNLYLELHNLVTYLGVEDLVRHFGAQRLIFGSYMPIFDPNVALMQVTCARICEEDKQLIAGRNLSTLIARVRR